jgi:MYXO-CTERM domain-containing protein
MNDFTLLQQARQLVQMGLIAALPLQALASTDEEFDTEPPLPPAVSTAQLHADYAAVGNYSNSGWFTGEPDSTKASASTLGLGFKLSGERVFQDSELYNRSYGWCSDGVCDASSLYYYRGDTTGIGFVWGGHVTGEFAPGDQLKAAYEFMVDWTHTPTGAGYDYAGVYWSFKLGFSSTPHVPERYQSGPASRGSSNETYGSFSEPGVYQVEGLLSSYDAPDYTSDSGWYWFAQLTFELQESGVRWTNYGDPAPASINGDYLRVVVPTNSIDVGVNAVPVPEPESWGLALAGLAVAGALVRRQRRV